MVLVGGAFGRATFAFSLLEIYDAPKATVTKLRQGSTNHATTPGDVLWKHKLFFRAAAKGKVAAAMASMGADVLTRQHKPRFILATDGVDLQCRDIKADQSLDIEFGKLNDSFNFLLPLAGIERYEPVAENPADVKAAGRLAKLYDAILEANPTWAMGNHTHELNLFMARLLFCLFAEDTSIFEKALFTRTIFSMTQEDGSDTASVLQTLFTAMDRAPSARKDLPEFAKKFPYVNGGLFAERHLIPTFSARSRRILKECGDLSWQDINPDIFGSMIQAVVEPGMRGDMGMHYTSVPNILKVLQPLFLLSLELDFEAARDNASKLQKLLDRIYSIRVFDPACGSGNFLIIAYRELRNLEGRIFSRLKAIAHQWTLPMTGVLLNHFYGIELADFAAETSKVSLWIAEYQMNEQFKTMFGVSPPALPLTEGGNIIHGNAARLDWLTVCPTVRNTEVYVVGNPPYAGSVFQTDEQKLDMALIFSKILRAYKDLDYVAIWFLKAADYCKVTRAQFAFVATNSICQGEQVAMLWPLIYDHGMEIGFAHQSFKWKNNAAHNAGVTCIIVGIRPPRKSPKMLYNEGTARSVSNIGPYLIEMDNTIIRKRTSPISDLPSMNKGNQPTDGGNLILSSQEVESILARWPNARSMIKKYAGSREFIKGVERYCLWITDELLAEANSIPEIHDRLIQVKRLRSESPGKQANAHADTPHQFVFMPHRNTSSIIVPSVASERRPYLTVGFLNENTVISNLACAIYDAPDYIVAILSSRLHLLWTSVAGGQMRSDLRYSSTLVYNTFPVPKFSPDQKSLLEDHAGEILSAREEHPGKTIAWLYNPETMPATLLKRHRDLDNTLERIYIGRPFKHDSERLEHLFKLYSVMTGEASAVPLIKKPTAVLEAA